MPSPRSKRTTATRPSGPRPFSMLTKFTKSAPPSQQPARHFLETIAHKCPDDIRRDFRPAIAGPTPRHRLNIAAILKPMTGHDHHSDHDHSELSETQLRVRALVTI